jgi:uncharacterized protein YajQ (UPF0234 family)
MPQDFSFDIVSEFDAQEVRNAVDQAQRELSVRFDFKGTDPTLDYEGKSLEIEGQSEFHLKQILDVLYAKAASRKVESKVFKPGKVEPAARGRVRQRVTLQAGIGDELARTLVKRIKQVAPKAQVQVQGDQLRVSSRTKDVLQTVIADLRQQDLDIPLQFVNYR